MGAKRSPGRIRAWIIHHEDSWVFVAVYVVLAVVLSAFISLFWLVLLVAAHLSFELIRHQAHLDTPSRIWSESLWAVKLDFGLILFAFTLTLYLPFVFGVLGLGTAARAAAAGTRFIVLQRAVRGVLLSVDDAAVVARGVFGRKKSRGTASPAIQAATVEGGTATASAHVPERARTGGHSHSTLVEESSWRGRWGFGDWASIVFTGGSLILILLAPYLLEHTWGSALRDMLGELHPWP